MAYASNDGVNRYQTTDGQIFNNEMDARNHQNSIDGSGSSSSGKPDHFQNEKERHAYAYNQIVKYYNAGNWDGVIKTYDADSDGSYSIRNLHPLVRDMVAIAKANRDGNYEAAFRSAQYGKPNKEFAEMIKNNQVTRNLYQAALDAGKKAWEKANGRTMTDTDLLQLSLKELENDIVSSVKSGSVLSGNKPAFVYYANEWEKAVGREMTKEDEIRIAGKTFLKRGLFGKRK
jgi:hypothetical protein